MIVAAEFAPALSLSFAGDDFELLALARIGGFHPTALFVPHRSLFVKPVMNAVWAFLAWVLGARSATWYGLGIGVHLANTALLGTLAARLSAAWRGRVVESPASESLPRRHPNPALDGPFTVLVRSDALTGLAAAGLWAVHDRLAEPLFSLSSLNHSFTLTLYLLSLLACVRALRTGGFRDRLLLALASICALFSYEVAASLIPTAAALTMLDRSVSWRERARRVGLPLGAASLVFTAVQILARAAPGSISYYRLSQDIALRNLAEIGLSFFHVRAGWIAPGPLPALVLSAALVLAIVLVRDRIVRFGLLWSAASYLPLAPIPEFSDRYHYIAFAGLALAAGRGLALTLAPVVSSGRLAASAVAMSPMSAEDCESRRYSASRRDPRSKGGPGWAWAFAGGLVLAHLAWSVGGAREQTTYYRFKSRLPGQLLSEASAALSDAQAMGSDVLVLVWPDDPGFNARWLARFETSGITHRFGESSHPIYVRPDAILGAVYPADLMTIAAVPRNEFYKVPEPGRVAQAVLENRARIVPLAFSKTNTPGGDHFARSIGERLRATLLERREIPVSLPAAEDVASTGSLRLAYFERTDRQGAFEKEYETSSGR